MKLFKQITLASIAVITLSGCGEILGALVNGVNTTVTTASNTIGGLTTGSETILNGEIKDAKTQELLIGAKVQVGRKFTATDDDGYYELQDIEPGEYKIIITKRGYIRLTKNVQLQGRKIEDFFLVKDNNQNQNQNQNILPAPVVTPTPGLSSR